MAPILGGCQPGCSAAAMNDQFTAISPTGPHDQKPYRAGQRGRLPTIYCEETETVAQQGSIRRLTGTGEPLAAAVAERDLAPASARVYRLVLDRLVCRLDPTPLSPRWTPETSS